MPCCISYRLFGECRPPLTHQCSFLFLPYTDSYNVDVLVYHWLTTLACLDKAGVHDRLRISEEALIGPINSLFSYGMLRESNQKEKERFRPRASFGIRTNLVDSPSSSSATVCMCRLYLWTWLPRTRV